MALLLALSACTCGGRPEVKPTLEEVRPAAGFDTELVRVELKGAHFGARSTLHFESRGDPLSVDTRYQAWLGESVFELAEVTWVDAETLTATVPAGAPVGSYRVRLRDPFGEVVDSDTALYDVRQRVGARLTATAAFTRPQVTGGETLSAQVELRNEGDTAAEGVAFGVVVEAGPAVVRSLPATATLAPGAVRIVAVDFETNGTGQVRVALTASGRDSRSGGGVSVGPLRLVAEVVAPAVLSATATASPTRVSVGQPITVEVTVTNAASFSVTGLSVRVSPSDAGVAERLSVATPQDLGGHSSRVFPFSFRAVGAGEVAFAISGVATDPSNGLPVNLTPTSTTPVLVEGAAGLAASLTVLQATVTSGQTFTLSLEVANTGRAVADQVTAGVPTFVGSTPTLISGPFPAGPVSIAAGATTTFTWNFIAGAPGAMNVGVVVSGKDSNSQAALSANPSAAVSVMAIHSRAALSGVLSLPARVNEGQSFQARLDLTNRGAAAALGTVASFSASGPGGALAGNVSPASVDLAPAATAPFTRAYVAGNAGTLMVTADATAADAIDLGPVQMPPQVGQLIVERRAALTATMSVRPLLDRNSGFSVLMTVQNTGSAAALAVTPTSPVVTPPGAATLVSAPGAGTIAGGGSLQFGWAYLASDAGTVTLSASANGTDGNDGTPVGSNTATSGASAVVGLRLIAQDPFGDGADFAYVVGYAGKVWLGPNRTGGGFVRMNADGTAPQSVGLSIPRDADGGTVMTNTSPAPFTSLGAPGCTPNTPACGPDNENGRGLLWSGMIAGTEWLAAGSALTNGLSHLYMTFDTAPILGFRYVDLTACFSGAPNVATAAHTFRDRVYVGFSGNSTNRPLLVVLNTVPGAPGLNAASPGDCNDLGARLMNGLSIASPAGIDTITSFNDRLYVFNGGACWRSTTNAPRAYGIAASDWANCSPTWALLKASISSSLTSNLTPADRAIPQAAVWNGRLYVGRNTTTGPQLWACNPAGGADPIACDPGDWLLVAPNSLGNDMLSSSFDDAANTRISMVVATPGGLTVGYDNATRGVVLFRSSVATPAARSDFRGDQGCDAALHPASCAGLGGSAFWLPGVTRLWSAVPIGSSLFFVGGSTGTGVSVYRLPD